MFFCIKLYVWNVGNSDQNGIVIESFYKILKSIIYLYNNINKKFMCIINIEVYY